MAIFLGLGRLGCMPGGYSLVRTSENSVPAKFAEFPFHALGRIRARRRAGLFWQPRLSSHRALALPHAPAAAGLGVLGAPLFADYLVAVLEVPVQRRLGQAQLLLALVVNQDPLPFLWVASGWWSRRTLLGGIAGDVVQDRKSTRLN